MQWQSERACGGICKIANLRGNSGKPPKNDFILVSRCSIRGFVEHTDIHGLGINVTTVDFLWLHMAEAAAAVHIGSQQICTKNRTGGRKKRVHEAKITLFLYDAFKYHL